MSQHLRLTQRLHALVQWLKGLRYVKFGLVGASGTVVNMSVLYLAQEYFFQAISAPSHRLYASLALAITIATLNNFTWNRLWTWADRLKIAAQTHASHADGGSSHVSVLASQLGRYAVASWFGIALQYSLTLWLSHSLHYMVANIMAILLASVSNFLTNDRWTFRHRPAK